MEHRKILNSLNEANDSKFVTNTKFSMIVKRQIMMQQMKLPIIQKFQNLVFVITAMLKF